MAAFKTAFGQSGTSSLEKFDFDNGGRWTQHTGPGFTRGGVSTAAAFGAVRSRQTLPEVRMARSLIRVAPTEFSGNPVKPYLERWTLPLPRGSMGGDSQSCRIDRNPPFRLRSLETPRCPVPSFIPWPRCVALAGPTWLGQVSVAEAGYQAMGIDHSEMTADLAGNGAEATTSPSFPTPNPGRPGSPRRARNSGPGRAGSTGSPSGPGSLRPRFGRFHPRCLPRSDVRHPAAPCSRAGDVGVSPLFDLRASAAGSILLNVRPFARGGRERPGMSGGHDHSDRCRADVSSG